jgi:prephenate dehydrogenase
MKNIQIGIIGGTGGIGRWMARFLNKEGYPVQVSGRTSGLDLPSMAQECPVVIVSVPIGVTGEVIRTVGPHMPKESLLMDVTSLKAEPVKAMLASSSSEVIGLHPLFGPRIKTLMGHNIVFCPVRGQKWLPWVKETFIKNGARLIETTPEHHDECMALVQGLNHLNSIALGLTLGGSGFDLEELKQYATPIFKTKLDILKKIFNQNSRLYAEMITQNPHTQKILEGYMESLAELKNWIDRKDNRNLQKRIDGTKLIF